jgi:poly(beta-D-mannuronate) lyase
MRGFTLSVNWWGVVFVLVLTGCGVPAKAAGRHLHVASEHETQQALSQASPGDHVVVKNGNYADWQLALKQSGRSDAPIVLRAETPGEVVFTGDTRIIIAADHARVRDFTFADVRGRHDDAQVVRFTKAHHSELANSLFVRCGAHKWQHIVLIDSGSDDNVVRYNKFVASKGLGVGISGRGAPALRNEISHNHFDGTTDDGEDNGQEPIQLGQDTYNDNSYSALVAYNLIENMKGDADPEMISVKMRGAHVRHNVLLHDGQGGSREIVLRNAADAVVEKNLLVGVGIRVFGPNHVIRGNQIIGNAGHPSEGIRVPRWSGSYPDTTDVEIADNVLIDTGRSCIRIAQRNNAGIVSRVRGVAVRRNICRSDRGSLYALGGPDDGLTYEANLAWGRARDISGPLSSGVERNDPQLVHAQPVWLAPNQDNQTWSMMMATMVGPAWQQTTIGARVMAQVICRDIEIRADNLERTFHSAATADGAICLNSMK